MTRVVPQRFSAALGAKNRVGKIFIENGEPIQISLSRPEALVGASLTRSDGHFAATHKDLDDKARKSLPLIRGSNKLT